MLASPTCSAAILSATVSTVGSADCPGLSGELRIADRGQPPLLALEGRPIFCAKGDGGCGCGARARSANNTRKVSPGSTCSIERAHNSCDDSHGQNEQPRADILKRTCIENAMNTTETHQPW
jgi:hypothetical protein